MEGSGYGGYGRWEGSGGCWRGRRLTNKKCGEGEASNKGVGKWRGEEGGCKKVDIYVEYGEVEEKWRLFDR